MKNLIYLLLFLLPIDLMAQKILEKKFPIASQNLFLNLKYANTIDIKYSNSSEVSFKVSIEINENKNNDNFELVAEEKGNELIITAQIKDIKGISQNNVSTSFSKNNYDWNNNHGYWDEENRVYVRSGKEISADIRYEIIVPRNKLLKVKTIGGDIKTNYEQGKLQLESINGNIDLTIAESQKVNFKFKTINGEVYSNLKLNFSQADKEELARIGGGYSKGISTSLNGGGEEISLKTISGDIFLRKQ